MNTTSPILRALLLLPAAAFAACSFAAPHEQAVRVIADNPQAELYANGVEIGRGEAIVPLPVNRRAVFAGVVGERKAHFVIERELSPYGIVDLAGGCCFLFPFIGLTAPGAWQLTQDTVPLHIPNE